VGEIDLSVLTTMIVSVASSSAIVWLLRSWISERLKNAIKHEYDISLEAFKAGLKAEVDKNVEILKAQLKAESDKEIEVLKARLKAEADVSTEMLRAKLQQANIEHQIRFVRLHEKVAETVAETYSKLTVFYRAVANYTKSMEHANDLPKSERRIQVADAMAAFDEYYSLRKLYIPKQTAEKIEEFKKKLNLITVDFWTGVEQDGNSRTQEKETWFRVWKKMSEDVPPLFAVLENDFQSILGIS
jgi:hypothetical protein